LLEYKSAIFGVLVVQVQGFSDENHLRQGFYK